MASERFQSAAQFLFDAHRDGSDFTPIPQHIAPRNIDEAYATQAAFQSMMAETAGGIAGYKVALTTQVMQQMVGFDSPIPGAVFAHTVHQDHASIACNGFNHLGIECELGMRLGEPLRARDAPFTSQQVERHVSEVMAAFELVDDRSVDYTVFSQHILSFIADNAWNAGVVLGAPLGAWHQLDLASIEGVLVVNDQETARGNGRDVMGNPLHALTWLANSMAERGHDLEANRLIMTGSIVATRFVAAGDRLSFTLKGVGEVSVTIT